MEENMKKEESAERVTNKSSEDSTLTLGSDGRPGTLITIKENRVNVKVLKLSMSRKHRFVMFIDLWTIAWVAGLTVGMSMESNLSNYVWIIAPIGFLFLLMAIGKTIGDFQNWLFTMNAMQEKMGVWYMDDVIGIVHDFINAGTKFAAEEVKKAIGGSQESETNDGTAEA